MRKPTQPQTFGEALDRALRYQQYKAFAMLAVWALLYLGAKAQEQKHTKAVRP